MSQSEPGAGADEAKRGYRQLPIGRAIAAAVLGPALLAFLQPFELAEFRISHLRSSLNDQKLEQKGEEGKAPSLTSYP